MTARHERSLAILDSSTCSASHNSAVIVLSCSGRLSASQTTCGAGSSTSTREVIGESSYALGAGARSEGRAGTRRRRRCRSELDVGADVEADRRLSLAVRLDVGLLDLLELERHLLGGRGAAG